MSNVHPTAPAAAGKPGKPYPDFPLFPHATRRWAKKIRGKTHYFGPWEDPDGALAKYLEQRDDLHAGRTPRVQGDGLAVRDLLNDFLTAKRHLLDTREITNRTFLDYHATCDRLGRAFGLTRLVERPGGRRLRQPPRRAGQDAGASGLGQRDPARPQRVQTRLRGGPHFPARPLRAGLQAAVRQDAAEGSGGERIEDV